jgi:hypothetical protein
VYPAKQPGGGNPTFRRQLKHLKDFIHRFDFVRMRPDAAMIKGGLPPKAKAHVLSEPGKQYAVYVFGGPEARLELAMPPGEYQVEWLNPQTGKIDRTGSLKHAGGTAVLDSPQYAPDIALRIVSR